MKTKENIRWRIRLKPRIIKDINRLIAQGMNKNEIVNEALRQFLTDKEEFVQALKKGLKQEKQNELIAAKEVRQVIFGKKKQTL